MDQDPIATIKAQIGTTIYLESSEFAKVGEEINNLNYHGIDNFDTDNFRILVDNLLSTLEDNTASAEQKNYAISLKALVKTLEALKKMGAEPEVIEQETADGTKMIAINMDEKAMLKDGTEVEVGKLVEMVNIAKEATTKFVDNYLKDLKGMFSTEEGIAELFTAINNGLKNGDDFVDIAA